MAREAAKLQVNLAVLTIGIDYFQVLSLFARSKIKWPPEMKALLKLLKFFQFDFFVKTDAGILVLTNLVLLCIQTPWMVWHFWWLRTNLYGENPSIAFEVSPLARVFATRPTFNLSQLCTDWGDAVDLGERVDVVFRAVKWPFEWILWLILVPFNLGFQGGFAEVDDPGVPMFLEKYSR